MAEEQTTVSRRTFLKVLGLAGAAAASPAVATQLIEANAVVPAGRTHIGLIRECIAYDPYRDEGIVRYDILSADSTLQLGVDARLSRNHDQEELDRVRTTCKQVLENEMKHRGLTWADLRPLPNYGRVTNA